MAHSHAASWALSGRFDASKGLHPRLWAPVTMKTASLRVPFETTALKAAVVSSLLTLAACGGGGSSSSVPIRASADGARAPVVVA